MIGGLGGVSGPGRGAVVTSEAALAAAPGGASRAWPLRLQLNQEIALGWQRLGPSLPNNHDGMAEKASTAGASEPSSGVGPRSSQWLAGKLGASDIIPPNEWRSGPEHFSPTCIVLSRSPWLSSTSKRCVVRMASPKPPRRRARTGPLADRAQPRNKRQRVPRSLGSAEHDDPARVAGGES